MNALVTIINWELPEKPMHQWDLQEDTEACFLAANFAKEFVMDFNAKKAVIRLGCDRNLAVDIGPKIRDHQLTQHYIRKEIDAFIASNKICETSLLALLWKEATDDIQGTPTSRIRAIQTIMEAMGFMAGDFNFNIINANKEEGEEEENPFNARKDLEICKQVFEDEY